MSAQTAHPSLASDRDQLRRVVAPTGIVIALVATAWTAVGVFYEGPENDHKHSAWEFYTVALMVVVASTVVGFLVPRGLRLGSSGRTALTLSAIAALLLPECGSGLPLVLGVGGAMLGYAGKNSTSGAGKSVAAFALGLVAVLGYLAIYILDTVDRGNLL